MYRIEAEKKMNKKKMNLEKKFSPLVAKRKSRVVLSEDARVITVPLDFSEKRTKKIINRVLSLSEEEAVSVLDQILGDFSNRHRKFRNILEKNYKRVEKYIKEGKVLTNERQLLIGAYFIREYSIESAALFNPSIVLHPDQSGLDEGKIRFIMSLRATGEGHISSIEFRGGIIDEHNDIFFDPVSPYVEAPEIQPDKTYNRDMFQLKLKEMGEYNEVTDHIVSKLPAKFTFEKLEAVIQKIDQKSQFPKNGKRRAIREIMWLARSNYEIKFRPDHNISERVIFPVSESESRGIEDARFVRFTENNGDVVFYATYTAYDGFTILPQLIETKDFLTFKIHTLNGKAVQNKGMALFPRKINGKFVMLSRQDNENNYIMFSDNVYFWQESAIIKEPMYPWEFIQIGNCGSPIETADGWLVLTHGVGPVKKYSIGVGLLDINDPSKVLARLDEPIIVPNEEERDGYVPNVTYTCGALIHQDELIIPYAVSDSRTRIATLSVPELLARLRNQ